MQAVTNLPPSTKASHLELGMKNAVRKQQIADYIERRFRPLLSRQKDRVRKVREIVSLVIGRQSCKKFVFERA